MRTTASIGEGELLEVGAAFQVEMLVRRYYELFNERRLDEAERLVDPQALFTYPIAREHLIGRAGYRELARRWLEAFPDARIRIARVHVSEAAIVRAQLQVEGTHRGRPAQLSMIGTLTIRHGLIVGSRLEFNPDALRKTLGH